MQEGFPRILCRYSRCVGSARGGGETHTCTADDGNTTNVKEKGVRGKSHEPDDGKTTNGKDKGARDKSREQSLVYAPGCVMLLLRENLANHAKQS